MEKPGPDDRYGDIMVDTARSHEVYRRWLALARPGTRTRRIAPTVVAAARLPAGARSVLFGPPLSVVGLMLGMLEDLFHP
jgi:hypothetical protein